MHSRIIFFDDSAPTTNSDHSGTLTVDAGEDEDYYYYYDFNNDEDFSVSDFPDYDDYQLGTRRKNPGTCIKVPKKDAKNKEWVRKIGPIWRSLAQQIGIRRCKTAITAQEQNEAIRFGI